MSETAEQLWGLIEPWLAAEQLELDDLEVVGAGRGTTLRVVVDGEDGVDLDRLAEVSAGISRVLDAETELEGPYQLEVTSPGLERTLTRRRHYEKSVGREVSVKVKDGEGARVFKGVLTDAGPALFTVETDAGSEQVDYDHVVKARTVFRWEKAPKPGKKKK